MTDVKVLMDAHGLERIHARVLAGIRRGETNAQIAVGLGVPVGTVKSRVNTLFKRLGVPTRAAAAALAERTLLAKGHTGAAAAGGELEERNP